MDIWFKVTGAETSDKAHWVKALAINPEDLSLISGTHMVGGS